MAEATAPRAAKGAAARAPLGGLDEAFGVDSSKRRAASHDSGGIGGSAETPDCEDCPYCPPPGGGGSGGSGGSAGDHPQGYAERIAALEVQMRYTHRYLRDIRGWMQMADGHISDLSRNQKRFGWLITGAVFVIGGLGVLGDALIKAQVWEWIG